MQRLNFLLYLKQYERTPAQDRDPGKLAERFARYAATNATDKERLGEYVWGLLAQADASQDAMSVLASAFTAADTIRNVVKYRKYSDGVKHAASFRTVMALRARRAEIAGPAACAEYVTQEKKAAFMLADILKVRRPQTLASVLPIEDIIYESGIALKPPSGGNSNGVYLLAGGATAVDLRRNIVLKSRKAVRAAMREDIKTKRVPRSVWNVEELILDKSKAGGMASDWKFHCFYGEIVGMGHIIHYPERLAFGLDWNMQQTTWLQPGTPYVVDPTSRHPPKDFLKLAKRLSLCLPAPYVRIDLMTSDEGPVLGEMTARPGVFDKYDRETDQVMGDAFLRAQARLESDMLAGKPFRAYHKLLKKLERNAQAKEERLAAAASASEQDPVEL